MFEIRVFVIGDYQVGKKSIVRRFKKLNSTETEDDNYFIEGDPRDEYGLGKNKSTTTNEKFEKFQDLEDEEKSMIRKQIERKNLMKFKKVFIVEKVRLEFNFFPIDSAEEKIITNVTEIKEEEDETKCGNKLLNLKKVIEEIKELLAKDPKESNSNLDNLFLFVYDLKDFSSFKKIVVYYNKLNEYFKIDSNYLKVLIGNKADSRSVFNRKDKDYFEKFIKNTEMKYYEISTYNYFSFERFFEKLFTDIIAPEYKRFQKLTFINRFHLVLHNRTTLSKAERRIHSKSDVPFLGEKENPDVYAYPEDKAEFRRTFSNMKRGRFGFKIFINKQGPTFPLQDKQGHDKNNQDSLLSKPVTALTRDKRSKTMIGFGNWAENRRNKEIRDALKSIIPGYSLGIKDGKFGFKTERKNKFQKRERELKSAFEQNNVGLSYRKINERDKKNINYIDNKKAIIKELIDKIHENEYKYLQDREKNRQMEEEKLKEKIEKIKAKQEKYQKIYEKKEKELFLRRTQLRHPNTARERRGKTPFSKNEDNSSSTLYDIRTKYDPNKGWTMGMKYNYDPNKNRDDPGFPKLLSDFDKIVHCPKYAEIKYTAPRFKEEKIVKVENKEKEDIVGDDAYKEKISLIKEKGERAMNLKTFLEERRDKRERVMENKLKIEEARKEEIEELRAKIPRNGSNLGDNKYDIDIVDINYNLVEECAPNYTIKGRHLHGSIFDTPENRQVDEDEDDDDEEKKIGSNGKPIQDEEYIRELPRPQYDKVKPSFPRCIFSKAKRFIEKPLYQPRPSAKNPDPIMLFENGVFKPNDVQSFLRVEGSMGKAKKDTSLKYNGIPGPNQYKINGFAEKIAMRLLKKEEKRIMNNKKKKCSEEIRKAMEEEMKKRRIIAKKYDEENIEQKQESEYNKSNDESLKLQL